LDIGAIWDLIILSPMINILVVVSKFLFHNLGLTIIAFTIFVRGILYPINRKQMLATKKMQDIQPKLVELQKKYARDRQKLAQEQMALYKQAGFSPLGCVIPQLIQLPIWTALYQAIMRVMASGPEQLLSLSRHLYSSWNQVFALVPLNSQFLWINMGQADRTFILPILVGATMWIQQKMTTPISTNPQQQSQNQLMLWVMPVLFALMSVRFSSGLALYWLISNIIGIVMQYFISGWGPLGTLFNRKRK